MIFIDESTVRDLLSMSAAIGLLESAFEGLTRGQSQSQVRRRLTLPGNATLHQLAGSHGNYFGTKIYSTHPKHGAWFLFLLYDAATAQPLALIEANYLGQIRTGAATGLATEWLARKNATALAVIGSGFQAFSQVEAVLAVRSIQAISVWSRNASKREAFARRYPNAAAVPSAEAALVDADIVITATNASEPVFDASLIRPGTHINAVGSNYASRRELPAEIVRGAHRIVVDSLEQARIEAGDLIAVLNNDADWDRIEQLQDRPERRSPDELTLFKSLGIGLEDVAVAAHVYERALAEGLFSPLPIFQSEG